MKGGERTKGMKEKKVHRNIEKESEDYVCAAFPTASHASGRILTANGDS